MVAEALEATILHSLIVILSLRRISYTVGNLFTCEHKTLDPKPLNLHLTPNTKNLWQKPQKTPQKTQNLNTFFYIRIQLVKQL
jgi:hypothetical protein